MLFESSTSIFERARYLQSIGEKYKLIRVNNTYTLVSERFGVKKSKNNYLAPSELNFIRKVKRYVQNKADLSAFFVRVDERDIKYVSISEKLNSGEIKDVIQIDADEAYWIMALNKGVISQEIYEEGKKDGGKLTKYGRLVALGSLAKKEYTYEFNKKSLFIKSVERSYATENVWFTICNELAQLMQEASKIAGDDFIHYWVDGIYLKNNPTKVKQINELFYKNGFKTKLTKHRVEVTPDQILVYDKNDPKPKPFFRPKHKKRRKINPELVVDPTARVKQIMEM